MALPYVSVRARMFRIFLSAGFICFSLFLFSFTLSRAILDDVWKQFGISQQQATANIKSSFLNGYLDKSGVYNIRKMAIGDRAAVAKDILTYSKIYLNSTDFADAYGELRNSAKPEKPEIGTRNKEDIRKEKIEETEKTIAETEEFIKTTDSEEMKKAMTETLQLYKTMLKDYKDPNSKTINMLYQGEAENGKEEQVKYKESLANWQTEYPENCKLFIKSKLQRYLSIANSVDFTAATVEKGGKTRFVKEIYEAKDNEWKMIFRAGKDVYDVTKPFAEQWVKEIQ